MHMLQSPIRQRIPFLLLAFLLCLLCLTMLGTASAEDGESFSSLYTLEALPPDIAAAIEGETLLSSAQAEVPEGDCLFVLSRTREGSNRLLCFTSSGDGYGLLFASTEGIPQGTNPMTIEITSSMEDLTTHEVYDFPVLCISQRDEAGEYLELSVCYRYQAMDAWRLFRIWSYTSFENLRIQDDTLSVFEDVESDQVLLSMKADTDLDLRCLNLTRWMEKVHAAAEACREAAEEMDNHG